MTDLVHDSEIIDWTYSANCTENLSSVNKLLSLRLKMSNYRHTKYRYSQRYSSVSRAI